MDAFRILGSGLAVNRTQCESSFSAIPSSSSSSSSRETSLTTSRAGRSKGNSSEMSPLVELGLSLALSVGMAMVTGLAARYLLNALEKSMRVDVDGNPQDASSIEKRLASILKKRGVKELPPLDNHELQMSQVVMDPDDIDSAFSDIGGLDKTKREIYELAILPLIEPELFQGKLVQPTKGILLYGKPGTGKTMLAKALAKEAAAIFIPLQLSKILNKYVGESNKMIAATFTLARKLAPAIIFIDELDTFLKASNAENAYLDLIKSEFLTWWDGVGTTNQQVLVLGATNKPQAIDSAILRRMPRAFAVPLPDEEGRKAILTLLFKEENLTRESRAFIPNIAAKTRGYSGSDLKEFAKACAMVAVQERTAEFAQKRVSGAASRRSHETLHEQRKTPLRPISVNDMLVGLKKVLKTGEAARSYGRFSMAEEQREQQEIEAGDAGGDASMDEASLRRLIMTMRALSNLSVNQATPPDFENNNNNADDIPEV